MTLYPDYVTEMRRKVRLEKTLGGQSSIPLYPEQQTILDSPKRFKIAVCGRRFGKTHVGARAALDVARGGGRVWWLAPSYAQAMEGYRYIKAHLIRTNQEVRIRESEYTIYFPSGGEIQVKTGDDPMMKKGAGLNYVVFDEAALLDPVLWFEVIRPTLADKKGGALFLSTPKGRNWFWQLYQGALLNTTEWDVFSFPSAVNPLITADELETIRTSTPEMTFRQEYLAEFIEDDGAVFRKVTDAVKRYPNAPTYSGRCVFGVDWAQMHDFTAIVVLDAVTKRVLDIEHFNQVSWEIQRGRLEALYYKWRPERILAELNSIGSPNIEALQANKLPIEGFTTTSESKSEIIQALVLGFERDEIAIPDNPLLTGELLSYTAERLPSGRWRYSAPQGLHDDMVIALALAYWQSQSWVTVEALPDDLLYYRGY